MHNETRIQIAARHLSLSLGRFINSEFGQTANKPENEQAGKAEQQKEREREREVDNPSRTNLGHGSFLFVFRFEPFSLVFLSFFLLPNHGKARREFCTLGSVVGSSSVLLHIDLASR